MVRRLAGWKNILLQHAFFFFWMKSCIFPFLLKKNKDLECLSSFQSLRVNYLQGGKRKKPFSTSRIQCIIHLKLSETFVFSCSDSNDSADVESFFFHFCLESKSWGRVPHHAGTGIPWIGFYNFFIISCTQGHHIYTSRRPVILRAMHIRCLKLGSLQPP